MFRNSKMLKQIKNSEEIVKIFIIYFFESPCINKFYVQKINLNFFRISIFLVIRLLV